MERGSASRALSYMQLLVPKSFPVEVVDLLETLHDTRQHALILVHPPLLPEKNCQEIQVVLEVFPGWPFLDMAISLQPLITREGDRTPEEYDSN
jgi:hypothetical protein